MFGSSVAKFRFTALKTREGKEIPADIPASDLKLTITGPGEKPVEGTITAVGGGSYDASWQPFAPGAYALQVTFGSEHVDGSPFKINIGGGGGEGKEFLPQAQGQRS